MPIRSVPEQSHFLDGSIAVRPDELYQTDEPGTLAAHRRTALVERW